MAPNRTHPPSPALPSARRAELVAGAGVLNRGEARP